MKPQYFLIIDSETTITDLVADFAAVVVNRKGEIQSQCAVLVGGIFTDPENHPLFFNQDSGEFWREANLEKRYAAYQRMLDSGSRMIAGVNAINLWLGKAAAQYAPILTAYNLPFDVNKSSNTGIDLTSFDTSFCLWKAAYTQWAHTRKYRQMILDCHAFNSPTKLGNMSFKTNAETMARFVLEQPNLADEPHTALEDIIFYELPILRRLLKRRSTRWILNELESFDWHKVQVKDWFKPS